MSLVSPHATLIREPLPCRWTAADAVQAISGERLPFALTGAWAGGGAIMGFDPLRLAGPAQHGDATDPFAVLDQLPVVEHDAAIPATAVGGGWFGWLGYRLAAAVELVPLSPLRPVPMPERWFAYHDNVLRLDPDGRWFFEALVTDERRAELRARLQRLRAWMAGPPPAPGSAGDRHR